MNKLLQMRRAIVASIRMLNTAVVDDEFPQMMDEFKEETNASHRILRDLPDEAFYDLFAHLHNQRAWSEFTFGPGNRTAGVIDHIRKELIEIEAEPNDLEEWIDVVILAFDGAWRTGASPQQIISALNNKFQKNKKRVWPDWRTADPDKAIEHLKHAVEPANR